MDDSGSTYAFRCCGINCWKKKREAVTTQSEAEQAEDNTQKAVFCGDLPQPLLPGHCIEVVGAPLKQCTRFSVNLTCSKTPDTDIAFHFNPRLEQNYVVRNSRQGGYWGTEETVSCYRFALPRKKNFIFSFFIAPTQFLVAINNQHFCEFDYRIPLAKVKHIEVHGDVTIDDVDVKEMGQYPPNLITENLYQVPFGSRKFNTDGQLPNPFIGHLPKGFQSGWQLEIHGKVKLLPHSFYVNLQEGHHYWPHPLIPLHLNPRFNTAVHAHTLVRNAWVNGAWGTEERSPGFNFFPGRPFHLIIHMESEHFTVWVNGKMEGEFKFRTTLNNIDTVYIQGDLYLYKVFVNDSGGNLLLANLTRA